MDLKALRDELSLASQHPSEVGNDRGPLISHGEVKKAPRQKSREIKYLKKKIGNT